MQPWVSLSGHVLVHVGARKPPAKSRHNNAPGCELVRKTLAGLSASWDIIHFSVISHMYTYICKYMRVRAPAPPSLEQSRAVNNPDYILPQGNLFEW